MPGGSSRAGVLALLQQLDEAYDRRSWHGTNLRGSLKGLTPGVARWRPREGRRNIWELILHAAYWKYAVRRRLTGAERNTFPLKGSNFFRREGGSEGDLRRDIALLAEQHVQLRAAIASLKDEDLARPNGRATVGFLVRGVAAHDLYHAGQIQLLKRLRG